MASSSPLKLHHFLLVLVIENYYEVAFLKNTFRANDYYDEARELMGTPTQITKTDGADVISVTHYSQCEITYYKQWREGVWKDERKLTIKSQFCTVCRFSANLAASSLSF